MVTGYQDPERTVAASLEDSYRISSTRTVRDQEEVKKEPMLELKLSSLGRKCKRARKEDEYEELVSD